MHWVITPVQWHWRSKEFSLTWGGLRIQCERYIYSTSTYPLLSMSGKYTLGSYYQPSVLGFNLAYKELASKHIEYFEQQIDYLKDFKPATYEGQLTKYRAMNEAFYYKRFYKAVYNYYDKLC